MSTRRPAAEVFAVALRLGLTSFGGPSAHLGYFRSEYVERRRWVTDDEFAEYVAIAQFLPGPLSSQVGLAVGHARAGVRGAVAAWLGFTLPSALVMAVIAALITRGSVSTDAVWLRALGLVAVAVVLDAVIGMARTLTTTVATALIAVAVGIAVLELPHHPIAQPAVLLCAAVVGIALLRRRVTQDERLVRSSGSRRTAFAALITFVVLLVSTPFLAGAGPLGALADAMYRSGALVFGGGHVVLPLLEVRVVPDLIAAPDFLAGYGAAQAMPGPLFTFGTYVGQVSGGPAGAAVATLAIFLPGILLMLGVLPFWQRIRGNTTARAAVAGVSAAVVGLLAAAWIDPLLTTSINGVVDIAFAAAAFLALRLGRFAPWIVVVLAVVASPLLGL